MKNILFIGLVAFAAITVKAQAPKAATLNPTVRVQEIVYKNAMENVDLEVATQAVYQLIALQPERLNWVDTLCVLYHARGYYGQSAKLAKEVLKRNPNSLPFREIYAQGCEATGQTQEALKQYLELNKASRNGTFIYKIASLQLNLKQYDDCEKGILKALEDESTNSMVISTQIDANTQEIGDISLRAALLNLRGILELERNNTTKAIEYFEDALKISPKYTLVRQNLEQVKKRITSTP